MISKIELRKNAWRKYRSAEVLAEKFMWTESMMVCGYAVEIMLKASICVAQGWMSFPHTKAEFNACSIKDKIKNHSLETLLNETHHANNIKANFMSDWTECLMWTPEMRYLQPPADAARKSAKSLLLSAKRIIEAIEVEPGLESEIVAATDNPYIKVRAAIREIEVQKGGFILAGVFHRKGSFPNSSDLLVCAGWMDKDPAGSRKYVSDRVIGALGVADAASLSGIFRLDVRHQFIQGFGKTFEFKREKHFFLEDIAIKGEWGECVIEKGIVYTSALYDADV